MTGDTKMMGGMWFFSLLFWILIIAGLALIVRWLVERNRKGSSPTESALDVLKKRYARGEIDQDTFEQMKRNIDN
jgi:putative membrane protein